MFDTEIYETQFALRPEAAVEGIITIDERGFIESLNRLNIKKKLNLQTAAEPIRHAVRWVEGQVAG